MWSQSLTLKTRCFLLGMRVVTIPRVGQWREVSPHPHRKGAEFWKRRTSPGRGTEGSPFKVGGRAKPPAPSPPGTDTGSWAVFHTPKYTCVPHPPLFSAFGKYPTIHQFMATVEIHGATTFILFCFVFNSVSEQHFPALPPTTSSRQLRQAGWRHASVTGSMQCGFGWARRRPGRLGRPVSRSSCGGASALPAGPDSFNVADQILGQADPKNLSKVEKEPVKL